MAYDSLVRTKQLNKPELSGYVVDILSQYLKTGSITGIATNTGLLTGQFYPLRANPSGYVTTGQLTGLATLIQVTGNNTALLVSVDTNYYPRSNPSGYITSGASSGWMPKSGAAYNLSDTAGFIIYDQVNSGYLLDFIPGSVWKLKTATGNAIIDFVPSGYPRSYISGFDVWTNSINGSPVMTSAQISGQFIRWDYVNTGKSLSFNYLSLFTPAESGIPGNFKFTPSGFLMEGYHNGFPSESYIIDMYGSTSNSYSLSSDRPFIYGFDIHGGDITSSGYGVLTTKDSTGFASKSELLAASGLLVDADAYTLATALDYVTGTGVQITGVGGITVYKSGAIFVISGATGNAGSLIDDGTYVRVTGAQNIYGQKSFRDVGSIVTMTSADRTLYDSNGNICTTWGTSILTDANTLSSVEWNLRRLKDTFGYTVVDWQSGWMKSGADITLDWNKRILSGKWNVQGELSISGQKVLTGNYLLSKGNQNYIGTLNILSGVLSVSGKIVTTGGPYYPRSSNPSGYMTMTGVVSQSDDFDPTYFSEYPSLVIGSVLDIEIYPSTSMAYTLPSARYWTQVQGYKTGVANRIVYSEILNSGYTDYNSSGSEDLIINWNPLNGYVGTYIVTLWSQVYGGGAAASPYPTGAWALTSSNKNGVNFSTLQPRLISGTTGRSPLGAISNYITWTGNIIQKVNVSGLNLTGNISITGIGGINVSTSGSMIVISGGASNSSNNAGAVSSLIVTGSSLSGNITFIGTGGVSITTGAAGTNQIIISGNTGQFITSAQTGQFAPSGMTGQFITSDKTGQFIDSSKTGQFVDTSRTGQFLTTGETRFVVLSSYAQKRVSQSNGLFSYFHPNAATYENNTINITGAVVFNTPIYRTDNRAFLINIKGYNYGSSSGRLENSIIVGYIYNGVLGNIDGLSGAILNRDITDLGTSNYTKTLGVNKSGYLALAICTTGDVHQTDRYTADIWMNYNTTNVNVSGWTWSLETGSGYGFLDSHILSSGQSTFIKRFETGLFVPNYQTGQFVDSSKTGGFVSISQTGQFITTAKTGQFAPSGMTGQFITTAQTGQFAPSGMTGQFITTAQTGIFYPASNPNNYITAAQAGGVSAVTVTGASISGNVNFTGLRGINISLSGQYILISGGDTGQFVTTAQTGGFVSISQTGQFVTSAMTGQVPELLLVVTGQVLSGNWQMTGVSGINIYTSGTQIAISTYSITSATGQFVDSSKTGGFVSISQTGQFITTAQTGGFYSTANPAGYITAAQAGGVSAITVTGLSISGNVNFTGLRGINVSLSGQYVLISGGDTGQFVTTAQTGGFVSISQTGQFVDSSKTGQFLDSSDTGWFVTTGETRFITLSSLAQKRISQTNGLFSYFYPNIATYENNTINITGAVVFNTPIYRTDNRMFLINIKGYNYGNASGKIENCFIGGYMYGSASGNIDGLPGTVINNDIIDFGNSNFTKTVGVNKSGYLSIAICTTGDVNAVNRYTADVWMNYNTSAVNPTGWVWSIETGSGYEFGDSRIVSSGQSTFIKRFETGLFVPTYKTGQFVDSSKTGGFVSISQTGQFITTAQTGQFAPSGMTGQFITTFQTGQFITTAQTGIFYLASNPNNYITAAQAGGVSAITVTGASISGNVNFTGLRGINISLSGSYVLISGGDTGQFITSAMTGQYITTAMTGQFAASGMTGQFITTAITGNAFYPRFGNPAGYIDSVSDQLIGGVKTFTGDVRISGTAELHIINSGQLYGLRASGWSTGIYEIAAINYTTGVDSSADIRAGFDSSPWSNYTNLGINSPNYTGFFVGYTGDGYCFHQGGDFYVGNITSGRKIVFFAGHNIAGTTATQLADADMVLSSGRLGIETGNPQFQLDVMGTGNFTQGLYVSGKSVVISTQLVGTGQFVDSSKTGQFYPAVGNPSNFLTSSSLGGVTGLLVTGYPITGGVIITGLGNIFVTTGGGNTIFISGITGNLVFQGMTGQFAPSGMTGQFITTAQTGQFAPSGMTGQFITTAQTGGFVYSGNTGKFLTTGETRDIDMKGFSVLNGEAFRSLSNTNIVSYYYPNVATYGRSSSTNITGGLVLNTPILRTDNKMVMFSIKGYNWGNSTIENSLIVGYAYNLQSGNIDGLPGRVINASSIDYGNNSSAKAIGINRSGYLAVAIYSTGSVNSLDRYTVDVWDSYNTPLLNKTGWFWTVETGSGYGFLDITYLSSGQLGIVASTQTGQFVTTDKTGQFVTTAQTGQFVTSAQTGRFLTSANTGICIVTTGNQTISGRLEFSGLNAGITIDGSGNYFSLGTGIGAGRGNLLFDILHSGKVSGLPLGNVATFTLTTGSSGIFNPSNISSFAFDIRAYRNGPNGLSDAVYSPVSTQATYSEVGSDVDYYLNLNWSTVANADGYKIVVTTDGYSSKTYSNGTCWFVPATNTFDAYGTGIGTKLVSGGRLTYDFAPTRFNNNFLDSFVINSGYIQTDNKLHGNNAQFTGQLSSKYLYGQKTILDKLYVGRAQYAGPVDAELGFTTFPVFISDYITTSATLLAVRGHGDYQLANVWRGRSTFGGEISAVTVGEYANKAFIMGGNQQGGSIGNSFVASDLYINGTGTAALYLGKSGPGQASPLMIVNNSSGQVVITGFRVITQADTGIFATASAGGVTSINVSGIAINGAVTITGIAGIGVSLSGNAIIISGNANQTGQFVDSSKTGQFITTAQTGQFAPSGMTGQFITTAQTGNIRPFLLNVSGQVLSGNLFVTGISGISVYTSGNSAGTYLVFSGQGVGGAAAGVTSIIYSGGASLNGNIRITGQHGISISGGSAADNMLFINPIRGTVNLSTGIIQGTMSLGANVAPFSYVYINWNSGEAFQYICTGSGYGPLATQATKIFFVHTGATPGKTITCSFVNTGVTFFATNGLPAFSGERGFYSGVVWEAANTTPPGWLGLSNSTTIESHADVYQFTCIGKAIYGKQLMQDAFMAGVVTL